MYGYVLCDSSGTPANYVSGDELVFYRTKQAAGRELRGQLKECGYTIRKIEIVTD